MMFSFMDWRRELLWYNGEEESCTVRIGFGNGERRAAHRSDVSVAATATATDFICSVRCILVQEMYVQHV